jgi:hypothetical protein
VDDDDDDQHRPYKLNVYWWHAHILYIYTFEWVITVGLRTYAWNISFSLQTIYLFYHLIFPTLFINRIYQQKIWAGESLLS